ncbi:MAG: hypothetical protein GY854_03290 [Deltaproteobacteria bacterium]|nr:hypothetical protein [Deltaproteobacteria bacterium]
MRKSVGSGASERDTSSVHTDDPFRMGERCSWYDASKLSMQWTYYFVTNDGALVYIGFAGRLHAPDGRPFSGINLVVLRDNKEVINLWNRFPTEALEIREIDLDISLGPNKILREIIDGKNRYTCHLEVKRDDGQSIVLDAVFSQVVDTCRDGGFNLLSWEEQGNYFEYEVPCPKGQLSGSLIVDGKNQSIDGNGYLESIRWLKSDLIKPAQWHWGYAYTGPYTVLFFRPGEYPHTRTLLSISRGADCVAVIEDAEMKVSQPTQTSGDLSLEYKGEELDLLLTVDSHASRTKSFPIFLAPYEIDLRIGETHHQDRGIMVFEKGEWKSF